MGNYIVDIPEVWTRSLDITADSEEEAIEKARNLVRNGTETSDSNFEYSHTMSSDNWTTTYYEVLELPRKG